MNERIKQLLGQAMDRAVPYTWDSLDHLELEKVIEVFAELVVLECANQCDLLLNNKMSSEWARGTHDCSKAIREHFGIV
jgi:hypothetical protein